jgi:hypothetical protein
MALHEPVHHAPKPLTESAFCFACAIAALTAAAVAIQWLMGFVG